MRSFNDKQGESTFSIHFSFADLSYTHAVLYRNAPKLIHPIIKDSGNARAYESRQQVLIPFGPTDLSGQETNSTCASHENGYL